jgi:Calcineurin-like phosphoesterase
MSIRDERIAIVGDIHGDLKRLSRALDDLLPSGRRLVFVGDYIDRGEDSFGVMRRLVALREDPAQTATFLRGNHEATLLRWLSTGDIAPFVRHGGLATVKSYVQDLRAGVLQDFKETFPSDHLDFLTATRVYVETMDIFVSHAGFDPHNPDARDEESLTFGRHGSPFEYSGNARPRDLVVFGHFVQRTRSPRDDGNIICLDTGCGTLTDGPLTVLLLPERCYLQF